MKAANAIAGFWQVFEQRSGALAQIRSADAPVYDELLEHLHRIHEGLFFEFSAEAKQCELIITAEGDSSLFDLVDSVVHAAPRVNGWTVFALKPKLGFPESVEWEGYKVDLSEVVFTTLSNGTSDDLGLRLLVPGLSDGDVENAHHALLRAIDHGLGERQFAEAVQYTEVALLEGPLDGYIPLVELERYIEWRKRRRQQ